MPTKSTKTETRDVVIVGGGPGGLYAAWRLQQSKPDMSIAIIEATSRIGGRVRTVNVPEVPFTLDIGAMRYLREQILVNALVDHYKLPSFEHNVPTASFFVRNTHILPRVDKSGVKQFDVATGAVKQLDKFGLDSASFESSVPPGDLLLLAIWRILARVSVDTDAFEGPSDEQVERAERSTADPVHRYIRYVNGAELRNKLDKLARSTTESLVGLRFNHFTIPEWIAIRRFGRIDGRPLYHYSMWELVYRTLSPEAFRLARACLGYQTIFGAWNAAEHIPWFLAEFGSIQSADKAVVDKRPNVSAVAGGMSRLIEKLWADLRSTPGVDLHKEHTVESVARSRSGDALLVEAISDKGERLVVETQRVILAVSKGALQNIRWSKAFRVSGALQESAGVDKAKKGGLAPCLDVVVGNPLMKAFALYETPWYWTHLPEEVKQRLLEWERARVHGNANSAENGAGAEFIGAKVVTDLAVRQLYLHGPADGWWNEDAKCARSIRGMIMAYCDARESEYWAKIWRRHRPNAEAQTVIAPRIKKELCEPSMAEHTLLGVSYDFKEVFERDLHLALSALFLNGVPAEPPLMMFFQNWMAPPFFGGWHAWNMGCEPQQIRRLVQQPFVNAPVYICGEAFSADQGWIEGALRTTESVLQNHFGVGMPDGTLWGPSLKAELERSHYRIRGDGQEFNAEQTLRLYLSW